MEISYIWYDRGTGDSVSRWPDRETHPLCAAKGGGCAQLAFGVDLSLFLCCFPAKMPYPTRLITGSVSFWLILLLYSTIGQTAATQFSMEAAGGKAWGRSRDWHILVPALPQLFSAILSKSPQSGPKSSHLYNSATSTCLSQFFQWGCIDCVCLFTRTVTGLFISNKSRLKLH